MMSDTEMQRKISDYKEAGVNPALAFGGVSNTEQASSAQQAGNGQSTPPMCICDFDGKDIIYTEMSTDDEDVIPLAPQVFTNYKSKLETYIHFLIFFTI